MSRNDGGMDASSVHLGPNGYDAQAVTRGYETESKRCDDDQAAATIAATAATATAAAGGAASQPISIRVRPPQLDIQSGAGTSGIVTRIGEHLSSPEPVSAAEEDGGMAAQSQQDRRRHHHRRRRRRRDQGRINKAQGDGSNATKLSITMPPRLAPRWAS